MMNSGSSNNNQVKRSVSETKKNIFLKTTGNADTIAAWFEVDHKVRLEHGGGSNNVDNLEALCRNCHGEKTAMENF